MGPRIVLAQTNQRPSDGRAIRRMDDHRVIRGLELGHDHPCPAEAAVNKCAAHYLPKCCRPGIRLDRLEWSPPRSVIANGAKLPAPPLVHSLACSRGSM